MEPELISSRELSERTGATYRQIDWWTRNGVISPVGKNTPGSGYRRQFDSELVGPVTIMVRVSNVLGHRVTGEQLKNIYKNYEQGYIDVGEGISIAWKKGKT